MTTGSDAAKPANADEVTTGFGAELSDSRPKDSKPALSSSFCDPFREAIELGLSRDRNAMAFSQDLVSESGFRGGYQTVKRFVRKLRGNQPLQPLAVILARPEKRLKSITAPALPLHDTTDLRA